MSKRYRNITIVWIVSLYILFMAILIPVLSAHEVELIDATPIRQVISENITDQSDDFIFSGEYVLWRNADNHSGTERLNGGLYLYSLRDNSTRPIAKETAGGNWIVGQTMAGDIIVWSQYPGTLHVYTISSGEERIIPDATAKGVEKTYYRNGINEIARWMPYVQGDRVVWLQGFSSATYGDSDIVLLNLTTNEGIAINESRSAKGGLVMSANRVVWYTQSEKRDGRGTSIFLHDLGTGADTAICSEPGLHTQTALSEKYLAWTDSHDPLSHPLPLSQINIYNLSTGKTQKIPTTTMNQFNPLFAGDYVIYTECYSYEISTNKRTCHSKIFDILTGAIWQFSSSGNNRNTGDYEYGRMIRGFFEGEFLIEEIHDGEREFGLYRINNLREPARSTIPAKVSGVPRENVTTTGSSDNPIPSKRSAPGFEISTFIFALSGVWIILRQGDR